MKKRLSVLFMVIILFVIAPSISYGAQGATYRALLIANSDYGGNGDLIGPRTDLIKMKNTLRNNYFTEANKGFSSILERPNLGNTEIIASIEEAFGSAKEGDVSYFFYAGHGYYDPQVNMSYLCGVDSYDYVSVDDLELALREIKGEIVIIIDSCHSGGFISTNSLSGYISASEERMFNQSLIDAFSSLKPRAGLAGGKYKIITAASKLEYSNEYPYIDGWGKGGQFTRAFTMGSGYNGDFLADFNGDGDVSLDEIYTYAKANVSSSTVQVYPLRDDFIIASKKKGQEPSQITWQNAPYYDVEVDRKPWNVRFNMSLQDKDLQEKVYILDYDEHDIYAKVTINPDGESLSVAPRDHYKYNSRYTLIIDNDIYSQSGKTLKNRILVPFFTERKKIVVEEEVREVNDAISAIESLPAEDRISVDHMDMIADARMLVSVALDVEGVGLGHISNLEVLERAEQLVHDILVDDVDYRVGHLYTDETKTQLKVPDDMSIKDQIQYCRDVLVFFTDELYKQEVSNQLDKAYSILPADLEIEDVEFLDDKTIRVYFNRQISKLDPRKMLIFNTDNYREQYIEDHRIPDDMKAVEIRCLTPFESSVEYEIKIMADFEKTQYILKP